MLPLQNNKMHKYKRTGNPYDNKEDEAYENGRIL